MTSMQLRHCGCMVEYTAACFVLQAIEKEHMLVDDCFATLLEVWLRGNPKMEDLLECLRGPVVARDDIASELESQWKEDPST